MMNLTITKISYMHGQCNEKFCPLCKGNKEHDPRQNINEWIHSKLTVVSTGYPNSPWWEVEEENGDCYRTLRGNMRLPGYYDKNPHVK